MFRRVSSVALSASGSCTHDDVAEPRRRAPSTSPVDDPRRRPPATSDCEPPGASSTTPSLPRHPHRPPLRVANWPPSPLQSAHVKSVVARLERDEWHYPSAMGVLPSHVLPPNDEPALPPALPPATAISTTTITATTIATTTFSPPGL